ncbi:MAG: alpha-hydroxy-acid oxidizing protein, partial [Terriglobus roseus]|nr:alpha-hydroxy-acid oxidizing protein [Terriglobus roseus]
MILYNKVYDVTDFLSAHPGGAKIILQLAGQDATEEYDPVHPPNTLEDNLKPSAKLGSVDPSTLPKPESSPAEERSGSSDRVEDAIESSMSADSASRAARNEPVDLSALLSIDDVEAAATPRLRRKAWAYYYSAGDDLVSKQLNNAVYRRILLRPRVFVDCTRCDTATSLLGHGVGRR